MSTKGQFLREFNEAFVTGDMDFVVEHLTDDITWSMVGEQPVQGKEAFLEVMKSGGSETVLEVVISNIITHGVEAAVNGTMKMQDTSGKVTTYGFCDIYRFSGFKNGRIKELTSYLIRIGDKDIH
ncbi:nuclear transport factor 2 family protein [Paenibacillus albidus]|uniref:nuclear transport factor 2 family protein n=1 Tax=Paenibacillus albidus TaxID=2041023 RepID=UPI001BED38D7|nr:nuclear transport factor 2 family protein [Paenibacillus albidus]MBT2293521.1 nuclear transport factor 2 family protein [Paenibacillus albidus]